MELVEVPAGGVIVMVGDPATKAFLIRKGTVELRRGTADSNESEAQLGPGEVFAEMGLIDERPHTMSARAITNVELSVLPRAEFELLLSGVPEDYSAFLNTLFERLRTISAHPSEARSLSLLKATASVTMYPLTRRAATTLPREGLVVDKFPFRIGRAAAENEEIPQDMNDLWLNDQIPYNVSRNHALIERDGERIIVKDRGSSLGIYVNEALIGGRSTARQKTLEEGDNIIVLGGAMSPYHFRVNISHS